MTTTELREAIDDIERIYAGPVGVKVRVVEISENGPGDSITREPTLTQHAFAGERFLALDVFVTQYGRHIG